jgi:integrase
MSPVSRAVGLALRLALLTGMRAGEVAGLARAEIENLDDPERAAITIPAARVKNGRAHLVALAPLAVETLRATCPERPRPRPARRQLSASLSPARCRTPEQRPYA